MERHPSTTRARIRRAPSPSAPAADGVAHRRRRLARVDAGWKVVSGVIATIATAVGMLTTFGILGGGSGPPPAVAVTSAAAKAADSGSSRILVTVMETRAGSPAGSGTMTLGAGEYDYRRGRGQMEYDLSQQKGNEDLYAVKVRFDGPTFFVRDPGTFHLAKNKPWLRTSVAELARYGPPFGALGTDVGIHDPTQALKELEAEASGTKRIGEEQLHGVKTTHYRAHRDPDGGGPARPVTEDVWVDENGYLRQLETVRQTASGSETTRTQLDDFGVHVDTALPPRTRVTDLGTGK